MHKEQMPQFFSPLTFSPDTVLGMDRKTWARLEGQLTEEEFSAYAHALRGAARGQHCSLTPEMILRPRQLFHASPNVGVAVFEPRAEKKRRSDDPPQIFATPSRAVASMFLVPTDDSFVISGSYDSGRTWTYIIGDEEKFRAHDTGGSIYALPSDSFLVDPELGLGLFEWTSKQPVIPESSVEYASGIQTMLEFGVRVYVVSAREFAEMRAGTDHIEILRQHEPLKSH